MFKMLLAGLVASDLLFFSTGQTAVKYLPDILKTTSSELAVCSSTDFEKTSLYVQCFTPSEIRIAFKMLKRQQSTHFWELYI